MSVMRGISLDVQAVLGTGRAAIGRRALLAEVGAAQAALARVRAWSSLRKTEDPRLADTLLEAAELGRAGKAVVLCGSPSAVRAAAVAARVLAPDAPLHTLTGPDAARASSLVTKDAVWVVVEGATWADAVAEWAVERGARVAVAGEGTHVAPPGGWWLADAAAGDGRWSASGVCARFVAACCGVDVGALSRGSIEAASTATDAPFLENPSAVLAVLATRSAELLGTNGMVAIAAHPGLAPLAEWFASAWQGSVRRSALAGSLLARADGETGVAGFGHVDDELLLEVVLSGARPLCVVWDAPISTVLPDGSALPGDRAAAGFADLCARAAVPRIGVAVPALDAGAIGAALSFVEHACALATVLRGNAPELRPAWDAWRESLARVCAADVDGDDTTA